MFNPNTFYLPVMPAQISGRCILPKFRFTFIKSVNIQNSLLRTWALGSHTQLKKMLMKIMRKSKHSICRFILILVGQILELPNRITVYFQHSNGHDPDTNQKLKQRLFNNLKAGASVAIWHFNRSSIQGIVFCCFRAAFCTKCNFRLPNLLTIPNLWAFLPNGLKS